MCRDRWVRGCVGGCRGWVNIDPNPSPPPKSSFPRPTECFARYYLVLVKLFYSALSRDRTSPIATTVRTTGLRTCLPDDRQKRQKCFKSLATWIVLAPIGALFLDATQPPQQKLLHIGNAVCNIVI